METKTKTPTFILKLAVKIFAFYGKQWEAYDAECAEYAAQGYRPYTCFHGTQLWSDYDVICGACEDGLGWFDPMLYRQMAISEAKAAYADFEERLDIYTKASVKHAPMDYGQMISWVSAPLTKWDAATAAKETAIVLNPPF
jgi:hypothetical protein